MSLTVFNGQNKFYFNFKDQPKSDFNDQIILVELFMIGRYNRILVGFDHNLINKNS